MALDDYNCVLCTQAHESCESLLGLLFFKSLLGNLGFDYPTSLIPLWHPGFLQTSTSVAFLYGDYCDYVLVNLGSS